MERSDSRARAAAQSPYRPIKSRFIYSRKWIEFHIRFGNFFTRTIGGLIVCFQFQLSQFECKKLFVLFFSYVGMRIYCVELAELLRSRLELC